MNILFGSHGFPPNQTGGAEWRTYRTARWLSEQGHGVHVIAVDKSNAGTTTLSSEQLEGIHLHRLSYQLDQTPGEPGEFNNPVVARVLAQFIRQQAVDIFHLISGYRMSGSAVEAARACAVPAVVTLTDFWFLCPRITLLRRTGELCNVPEDPLDCTICLLNEQRRYRLPYLLSKGRSAPLLKQLWRHTSFAGFPRAAAIHETMRARRTYLRPALALFDKVIAPSHFLAELFATHGVARERLAVIRQGVDLRQEGGATEARSGKPLVFGYIGQLAAHKGVDLLVQAFRQLPYGPDEVQLILYGNPAHAWPAFLEKLKHDIGDDPRIVLGGYFANTAARQAYTGLDVVVMPSVWYENSPNVILEAFAYGTPVMTANLGGMAELVEHDVNGYLFAPRDVGDLHRAMQHVVDHRDRLAHWRANLPPIKSVAEEMQEVEALYTELLMQRQAMTGTREI